MGADGSFWVSLFEKAWAKMHGNFNHIIGGDPGEAIYAFTGSPAETKVKSTDGQ